MDPSLLLERTVQGLSNIDAEFKQFLEQIRYLDKKTLESRAKYTAADLEIQKLNNNNSNGVISEGSKEAELQQVVRNNMEEFRGAQNEKCLIANTALFLISRQLDQLEKDLNVLEEEGIMPPEEEETFVGSDLSRESSTVSLSSGGRKRKHASSSGAGTPVPKRLKHSRGNSLQKQALVTAAATSVGNTSTTAAVPALETETKEAAETNETKKGDVKAVSTTTENDEEDKTLYCFCRNVSYGEMVACDGPHCKYEWFHYACVNLTEPPKGTWYCPDCRKEMEKQKDKEKEKSRRKKNA